MALKAWREVPSYQLEPGCPDVLGWSVIDREGKIVGPVVELYLDDADGKVRFLGLQLPSGQVVLLPLAPLVLEPKEGRVRDPLHFREEMASWPSFSLSDARGLRAAHRESESSLGIFASSSPWNEAEALGQTQHEAAEPGEIQRQADVSGYWAALGGDGPGPAERK